MKILAIGDVVGGIGCRFLREKLPGLKKEYGIDLVIANGENSADGNGLTPASAHFLFDSGVQVITTGNHAFRRRESYPFYEEEACLLRPANFPGAAPGLGVCVYDMGRIQVAVINLMGVVYLEPLDNPFKKLDEILRDPDLPKLKIVDFHAEATGEKRALGFDFDGKVTAIFGTHTHVQTADACILPGGTGYITDAGMTGTIDSVLGVKPELAIEKQRSHMPVRFDLASGPCKLEGVLFDADEKAGLCKDVKRIQIFENIVQRSQK